MKDAAETLRIATGWTLMAAGAAICGLSNGKWLSAQHDGAAFTFALLLVAFLLVFLPRLGSIHDATGVLSALAVGASAFLILNHIFDHRADGLVADVYHAVQDFANWLLKKGLGELTATAMTSPLYLVSAMALLVSFATRRVHGFLAVYGLVLASGLYPPSVAHLLAYLLWFAGFALVAQPQLHLPLALRSRLGLSSDDRFFLLKVREQSLTELQTVWHLCGQAAPGREPTWVLERLRTWSAAGLIEYDPAAQLVVATPLLQRSDLLPGTEAFVQFVSSLAQGALIVLAAIYFLLPIDLLPELLLGPVGYVDDLLVAALGLLPVARRLPSAWSAIFTRKRPLAKPAGTAVSKHPQP